MILICITALIISACTMKDSDDGERLGFSPSYSTANRWTEDGGRITDLSKLVLTKSRVYHLDFESAPPSGSKLIIKSENMGITAYIGGKMLYKAESDFGTRYNIIPIDEISDGGALYLHLSPTSKMTGKITDTVRITTQNDFLFTLLRNRLPLISVLFLLILLLIAILVFTCVKLSKSERKYFKNGYLTAFLVLVIAFLLGSSDLLQIIIGSAVVRYVIKYTSLMLLPVPLAIYITALTKQKSKPFDLLQCIIVIYSLLRLLLFASFHVPLERGMTLTWIYILIEIFVIVSNIITVILRIHKHTSLHKEFNIT